VFLSAFVLHAAIKVPTMRRSLRERRLIDELRRGLDETLPETGASTLIAAAPSAPTISRRGVLGLTGGASLGLLVLRDIAALAGVVTFDELYVESLQRGGSFRRASLSPRQAGDRRSLLALRVNGADLSADHGYPARIVVPALPGVHCTKWVTRLEFRGTRA